MANVLTQAEVEKALGLQPGQATGGYAQRLIDSNPQAKAAFMAAIDAKAGIMPAAIEPLHQFEKAGLTQQGSGVGAGDPALNEVLTYLRGVMGNPNAGAAYVSPEARALMEKTGGYYDRAASAYDAGMKPITAEDIRAQYNPFEEDVIKYAGDRAKAAILSNLGQRGAASFGDTATGVRMSELERIPFQYRYDGYNDAAARAEQERQRAFQGGSGFSTLGTGAVNAAGGAQNIYTSGMNNMLAIPNAVSTAANNVTNAANLATDRQIGAGGYIRGYNQNINDIIQQELLNNQNYQRQNIATTQGLLDPYQSSTQNSEQATSAGKNAGWAGLAGSVLEGIGKAFI